MYVIAVNKSQEFLLNVRRLLYIFFDDDARDLTSTTSRCLFDDVQHSHNYLQCSGLVRSALRAQIIRPQVHA